MTKKYGPGWAVQTFCGSKPEQPVRTLLREWRRCLSLDAKLRLRRCPGLRFGHMLPHFLCPPKASQSLRSAHEPPTCAWFIQNERRHDSGSSSLVRIARPMHLGLLLINIARPGQVCRWRYRIGDLCVRTASTPAALLGLFMTSFASNVRPCSSHNIGKICEGGFYFGHPGCSTWLQNLVQIPNGSLLTNRQTRMEAGFDMRTATSRL